MRRGSQGGEGMRRYTKYHYLYEASEKLIGLKILSASEERQDFISRFIRKDGEVVECLANCIRYNIDWLYGYLMANGSPASRWLMNQIETKNPGMAVDNFHLDADTSFVLEEKK
jgi:hypothetical protein